MPIVSKTVEVAASAESIMAIVAGLRVLPAVERRGEGLWVLAHYDDGRPSQLRLDASVQGFDITYVQAIYYPGENQIQTVMQQGDLFSKQEQLFSVVAMGPTTLLTVDLDVEVTLPVPKPMVKKMVNDALDHLADNLKKRAEALRELS